jgi:cell division septal protein FtsQ
MKRRIRRRPTPKPINILHTTTRKRPARQQVTQIGFWAAVVLCMLLAVGAVMHFGVNFLLNQALYSNPHYVLRKIDIEPAGHFSPYNIRQAAGLEPGENLWTLNLPQIAHDLEKLPYVSSAKVERCFPDRVVIRIHERVPVVKITGINVDIGTRETFYLDKDCIVLTPRRDEPAPVLPEIIGLTNAELEPGARLEEPSLARALEILRAIDHSSTLHTSIDIRSIDLSQPLSIKMTTTRELVITFRTDYVDQQLARLVAIFERYGNDQQRTLHTVDLTPDQNVPITFYE